MYKAVLFDLDGVITDTAELHFNAWSFLATELGGQIDEEFNEHLKGVDRTESLKRILNRINVSLSEEEFNTSLHKKNEMYISSLDTLTEDDILPGIKEFFIQLQNEGIKIIIASASKNAPLILQKLKLMEYIDDIANPSDIKKGKPAPDIFQLAAKLSGHKLNDCVGIEDSQSGLDALNSAGIDSIAIGKQLKNASLNLESTSELNLNTLTDLYLMK